MGSESRTEKPTPRRRQKAREEGRVSRTPELGAAISAAATVWILSTQFAGGARAWAATWRWALQQGATTEIHAVWGPVLAGRVAFNWLLPPLAACFTISLVVALAQGGLVLSPTPIKPALARINPVAKLQQMFSISGVVGMAKSLVPVLAMTYLAGVVFARDWNVICGGSQLGVGALAKEIGTHLLEAGWKCSLVLFLWAGVDFLAKRQKFEHDLRMSHQEIREEMKESEGNPQIKVRIRKLQRQVRRRRMLEDVARAAVVITNPTEYAIALEYHHKLVAPIVIAKGRNLLAQQIKQTAFWSEVPTVENVPLAHALYRTADVGQAIPVKLYAAVAEVLAFIFRAQARAKAGGAS
jgi:flagellar biosynthesis protein FlhB